jgi:hypothetical protein
MRWIGKMIGEFRHVLFDHFGYELVLECFAYVSCA